MIQYIQSKGWKRIYVWLFFTIPFLLFIMEESVQTLGFGRFTLIQGKLWTEALEATKTDKKVNSICLTASVISVPLNPLAGGVFTLYFIADRDKMKREVMRIENELLGYTTEESQKPNVILTTVGKFGSRKLSLLIIGITILIFCATKLRHRPKHQKAVMIQWNEADLRMSAEKIGIDPDNFIDFCNTNKIPISGKEKQKC